MKGFKSLRPFVTAKQENRGRRPIHHALLDADIYARVELLRRARPHRGIRKCCDDLVANGYTQIHRRKFGDILWEPTSNYSGAPPPGESRITLADARRNASPPGRLQKPGDLLAGRYFEAKRQIRINKHFANHCAWLLSAYTENLATEARPLTVIRIHAAGAMLYTEGRDGTLIETEYVNP